MIRIQRKLFSQVGIASGDKVTALMPIPPGGSFLGIRGSMHVISVDVPHYHVIFPAARCYAVQTEADELANTDWDTLWDRFVPKDEDTTETAGDQQVDVDTSGSDARPFEEPGEANPNELFGMQEPAKLLWRRDDLVSVANSPSGYDASANTYVATAVHGIGVRRRIHFPRGGFVAIGYASPTWDDVSATTPKAIASVQDLLMYGNLPDFLHTARLALIGATESNSESPFVDVLSLIEELVEPTVYEEDTGFLMDVTYRVYTRVLIDVGIPENSDSKVLKSD
jgi:hypothetical protein